jgi:DNA-binding GntR family transcriptional regulator
LSISPVARSSSLAIFVQNEQFTLGSYLETVKETHHLIVGAAANDYLADALAPAQALSRRFWIAHMRDEEHQISLGSALHTKILEAILARDPSAAKATSQALNDYPVDFAYAALGHQKPLPNKDSPPPD